jgi:hypothetical protein
MILVRRVLLETSSLRSQSFLGGCMIVARLEQSLSSSSSSGGVVSRSEALGSSNLSASSILAGEARALLVVMSLP